MSVIFSRYRKENTSKEGEKCLKIARKENAWFLAQKITRHANYQLDIRKSNKYKSLNNYDAY